MINKKDQWMDGLPGAIPRQKRYNATNDATDAEAASFIKLPEYSTQQACEDRLNADGAPYLHIPDEFYKFLFSPVLEECLFKNSVGLYKLLLKTRNACSEYLLGAPDLLIFDKTDRIMKVELKSKTGHARQGQIKFAQKTKVLTLRSYSAFDEEYKKFKAEGQWDK